jgi:hypothetical protein
LQKSFFYNATRPGMQEAKLRNTSTWGNGFCPSFHFTSKMNACFLVQESKGESETAPLGWA